MIWLISESPVLQSHRPPSSCAPQPMGKTTMSFVRNFLPILTMMLTSTSFFLSPLSQRQWAAVTTQALFKRLPPQKASLVGSLLLTRDTCNIRRHVTFRYDKTERAWILFENYIYDWNITSDESYLCAIRFPHIKSNSNSMSLKIWNWIICKYAVQLFWVFSEWRVSIYFYGF